MLRNGLEPWHLLVVVIVAVLIFGSKRLPDTARALGKSLRILKSETRAMKEETASADSATPQGTAHTEAKPHTIQAAPGDVASARPVHENDTTPR